MKCGGRDSCKRQEKGAASRAQSVVSTSESPALSVQQEGSPPDEKLVELLCRSVKASFKPAQDQCTLQVAPIINNQGVAVKNVIIESELRVRGS